MKISPCSVPNWSCPDIETMRNVTGVFNSEQQTSWESVFITVKLYKMNREINQKKIREKLIMLLIVFIDSPTFWIQGECIKMN
jgi:hypothetical protein